VAKGFLRIDPHRSFEANWPEVVRGLSPVGVRITAVGLFTRILLRNERLCTPPERPPH